MLNIFSPHLYSFRNPFSPSVLFADHYCFYICASCCKLSTHRKKLNIPENIQLQYLNAERNKKINVCSAQMPAHAGKLASVIHFEQPDSTHLSQLDNSSHPVTLLVLLIYHNCLVTVTIISNITKIWWVSDQNGIMLEMHHSCSEPSIYTCTTVIHIVVLYLPVLFLSLLSVQWNPSQSSPSLKSL